MPSKKWYIPIGLSLIWLLTIGQFMALAQSTFPPCRSNLSASGLKGKTPGSDGKIHVKVGIQEDPNHPTYEETKTALTSALGLWNAKSATTGIVFDQAGPNDTPDVKIKYSEDNSETSGCLALNNTSNVIAYNSGFSARAYNKPTQAAAGFAHEIGHYLGLGEGGTSPQSPTIMNNVDLVHSDCASGTVPTTSVTDNDAIRAAACVTQIQNSQPGGGGGSDDSHYGFGEGLVNCAEVYLIVDHYWQYDDGSLEYIGTDTYDLGMFCGGDLYYYY